MDDKPWYEGMDQLLMVHLIQCDLAKHTAWFAKCRKAGLGAPATKAKQELAGSFTKVVSPRFVVVFWRGDGGLYAARQEGTTGDDVVRVALNIRGAFLNWQRFPRWSDLHLEELALRLSCHTCNVWVGNETAHWTSVDLNRFVKYERLLSHEDTLAITHATFDHLETLGPQFMQCSKTIDMNDQEPEKWKVYYYNQVTPEKAMETTIDWFRANFDTNVRIDNSVVAETQRFALGESIVLCITTSSEESLDVEMQEEELPEFTALLMGEYEAWRQLEDKITKESQSWQDSHRRVDIDRASPLELRMPLKDFPIARITYCSVRYSKTRSFLQYITQNPGIWHRLAKQGVDYTPDAPRRPGILAAHMTVITNEGDKGPHVILSQRSKRQKAEVGFHQGLWSSSLEEQCERHETTIRATVVRGLKEELLGAQAERTLINVAALFLERPILNLTAGVVCRINQSFNEVHDLWQGCDDRDEHTQIIALPLKMDLVKGCIDAGELTEQGRAQCLVREGYQDVWGNTGAWALHPTSAFRLALALRAIQAS